MKTNLDRYNATVAGADAWDKRYFDQALIGALLDAVDADTARRCIESATAVVNAT